MIIHLYNLKFIAFHGVYEEEKILGNEYELNIDVEVDIPEKITQLDQTLNYVSVYEIVKQRMAIPSELLETIAQDLADLIYAADNRVKSVAISIKKINPPIANFQGSVGVSYTKLF